jgi:hypothetical protein
VATQLGPSPPGSTVAFRWRTRVLHGWSSDLLLSKIVAGREEFRAMLAGWIVSLVLRPWSLVENGAPSDVDQAPGTKNQGQRGPEQPLQLWLRPSGRAEVQGRVSLASTRRESVQEAIRRRGKGAFMSRTSCGDLRQAVAPGARSRCRLGGSVP